MENERFNNSKKTKHFYRKMQPFSEKFKKTTKSAVYSLYSSIDYEHVSNHDSDSLSKIA